MKIYTKTGDKGTTSLIGGERVSKTDIRLEGYGTVDELQANVAYLRDCMVAEAVLTDKMAQEKDELLWIEERLMVVSSVLAADVKVLDKIPHISNNDIERIEKAIDRINLEIVPLTKFTIPGGHPLVSFSHIARTVCRRAERAALRVAIEVALEDLPLVFLNRLSDYLYVLGRLISVNV
ncbi:MAG: cob(I)yrinic acid a,c-diamide adenosyltransferase, partial [Rikenellaceae bacterium]